MGSIRMNARARRGRLAALPMAALLLAVTPLVALAAPGGGAEPTYFDGQVVYMKSPANGLGNSLAHSQGEATKAYDLYLAVYPVASDGFDAVPKQIDGWYRPNCDPCFHFGTPDPYQIQFHDHIIDGAPGFGTNGTAGGFSAPWRVKILVYNMDYIAAHAATWQPVKSDEDIDGAVTKGEFLGPAVDTGVVILCPIVSPNAH